MNFLAHLHIADYVESDLAGNFLGDFVKGDPYQSFPKTVADGIKLHRFVDSYTDQHNTMKQAKSYFSKELRRFAPIALDLFWDHCLAKEWDIYHRQSLAQFCVYAETKTTRLTYSVPDKFIEINNKVWQGKWFESYQRFSNLEYALYRMSQRSERMGALADCYTALDESYDELLMLFPELYREVLSESKKFHKRQSMAA